MDSVHSVTCPQAIRVKSHRSEQAKWRQRKKWKLLVAEHCHVPEAVCVHCGKHHRDPRKNGKLTYLTINHLSRKLYETEELYTTWNPELMEICCTMCNWMIESGKVICPVCKNQYIRIDEPDGMCQGCYDKLHPEEAAARKERQKKRREDKRALLKKLRHDQAEKVKKWKQDHPRPACAAQRQGTRQSPLLRNP